VKVLRKLLILSHRYLGIVVAAFAVMWFATGITMMYVGGMPRLTPERRLASLPEIDLSQVKLTVADAAARAEYDPPPTATLVNVMNRPAYRFGQPDPITVFADTGEFLAPIDAGAARRVAADFMRVPETRVAFVETILDTDQWTLGQAQPPLHRFRVDDDEGTELYVSPGSAEVVQLTTRRGRGLAWISTIPHWLYFSALRNNQPLWYRVVVWSSGLLCVVALLGLALGITQWRRRKPFDLSASIPYRGAMRWHYVTGAVFGVFTLTFAFSGLLSMEPFAWTSAPDLRIARDVFTGGSLELARFPAMQPDAWTRLLDGRALKEVDFVRIQDDPYFVVRSTERAGAEVKRERLHQPYYITGRAERDRMLVAASTLTPRAEPFSARSLESRLKTALPDVPVVETALLTEYDSYYYSRNRQTPLPVVRVKLADPAETWVYIDPETGQILSQVHRLSRVERWLYNGLHSLDFAFWYNRRPLWDIGMIILLLGGLTTSGIGLVLGVRRVRRGASRALAPSAGVPPSNVGRVLSDPPARM
jgi:uncharacterized iron-regulated membrane protein